MPNTLHEDLAFACVYVCIESISSVTCGIFIRVKTLGNGYKENEPYGLCSVHIFHSLDTGFEIM